MTQMEDSSFTSSKETPPVKGRILTGVFKSGSGKVKRCGVFTKFLASGFEVFHVGINVNPSLFTQQMEIFSPQVLILLCQGNIEGVQALIEWIKKEELRSRARIILYGTEVDESIRDEVHADACAESEEDLFDMVNEIVGEQP